MAAVFGSVAILHAQEVAEVAEVAKVSTDSVVVESVAKETLAYASARRPQCW